MYQKLYDELNSIGLTEFNYRYNNGEKVAQFWQISPTYTAQKVV